MYLVAKNDGILSFEDIHNILVIFIDEFVLVHRSNKFRINANHFSFSFPTALIYFSLVLEGVWKDGEVVELLQIFVLL